MPATRKNVKKNNSNKIQHPFTKDCYIRKRTFDFFRTHTGKSAPGILVGSAIEYDPVNHPGEYRINGKYQLTLDNIVFITKKELDDLYNIYHSLELSKPVNLSVEETCYTNYSGKRTEKVKVKSRGEIIKTLYLFKMRKPEEKFQAYLCPNCGFYHIGKIDPNQKNSTFIQRFLNKVKSIWNLNQKKK